MKLKVLVVPEAVGGYSVSVPAMPGCYSEGETLGEALVNIREAAELWVDSQTERACRVDVRQYGISEAAQLHVIDL